MREMKKLLQVTQLMCGETGPHSSSGIYLSSFLFNHSYLPGAYADRERTQKKEGETLAKPHNCTMFSGSWEVDEWIGGNCSQRFFPVLLVI